MLEKEIYQEEEQNNEFYMNPIEVADGSRDIFNKSRENMREDDSIQESGYIDRCTSRFYL